MIEYRRWIYRNDLVGEPKNLFVFGDNIERSGFGGQAVEMRGEPNAVGIPTKVRPGMNERSFFTNDDVMIFMRSAAREFRWLIRFRGTIVWPKDGIGTGRAQLERRAPLIWNIIEALRKELESSRWDKI